MITLPGRVFLVFPFLHFIIFFFHHFKYYMSLPSGLQIFAEKSADNIMEVPLYETHFSLADFNVLSLFLIFAILITMCLVVVFFGTLCASWT